jgi:transposase-like protein
MGSKTGLKCIRCGSRGRVRVNVSGPTLKTYTCGTCKSVFTDEALQAAIRAEEAALGGLR